jgi:hypothetical protein
MTYLATVIHAQAGIHIPETVAMDPGPKLFLGWDDEGRVTQ